jgi:RNA polymerase sigma factor (sigma-70 family)
MDDLTLVQHMARYVLHRFPDILEFDELVSEGWIFLCGLREKGTYDPIKNDWEAYAKRCVVRYMLVVLAQQRKQGFWYAPQKKDMENIEYNDETTSDVSSVNTEIDVLMSEMLVRMKKVLLVREFEFLREFYFEGYTINEMAKKHGLSKQRIQQIIKKAERILRSPNRRVNRLE